MSNESQEELINRGVNKVFDTAFRFLNMYKDRMIKLLNLREQINELDIPDETDIFKELKCSEKGYILLEYKNGVATEKEGYFYQIAGDTSGIGGYFKLYSGRGACHIENIALIIDPDTRKIVFQNPYYFGKLDQGEDISLKRARLFGKKVGLKSVAFMFDDVGKSVKYVAQDLLSDSEKLMNIERIISEGFLLVYPQMQKKWREEVYCPPRMPNHVGLYRPAISIAFEIMKCLDSGWWTPEQVLNIFREADKETTRDFRLFHSYIYNTVLEFSKRGPEFYKTYDEKDAEKSVVQIEKRDEEYVQQIEARNKKFEEELNGIDK